MRADVTRKNHAEVLTQSRENEGARAPDEQSDQTRSRPFLGNDVQ